MPNFDISIHVPLAGDDRTLPGRLAGFCHFYPRPPCGGRPQPRQQGTKARYISIPVPLAGDDRCWL